MGEKLPLPVRTGMMLAGILLIGVSVALYRLAAFGVDPFTGMNLGISTFLGWSFGNWQLLANALILAVVFFTVRSCIGLGTVVNMVPDACTVTTAARLGEARTPLTAPWSSCRQRAGRSPQHIGRCFIHLQSYFCIVLQ